MITLQEAQRFVLSRCHPNPPQRLALDKALGCVTAASIVATEAVPPFDNSSMDGYAVRAADTIGAPVTLKVIGTVMAGHPINQTIGVGESARIMTGAPIPDGADAVCMIEETEGSYDSPIVTIRREISTGSFIRHRGQDVNVGNEVVPPGISLTPAHLGLLAGQGLASALTHPRPRIGVISTGDELFSGAGPLPHGLIRDANRHSIVGLARREGLECVDLGIVRDDETDLEEIFKRGAESCDVLITSGGVSVGDLDLVRVVLERLSGGSMRWMQVAIRPAKPFAFGILTHSGTPVFGLPGNPVSAMVSFELFVRPALRQLSGQREIHRRTVKAIVGENLTRHPDGKMYFLRAITSLDRKGQWQVQTATGQESHQLSSMAAANSLLLLPDGYGIEEGCEVDVLVTEPELLLSSIRASWDDSANPIATP